MGRDKESWLILPAGHAREEDAFFLPSLWIEAEAEMDARNKKKRWTKGKKRDETQTAGAGG